MVIEILLTELESGWQAEIPSTNLPKVTKNEKHNALHLIKTIVLSDMLSSQSHISNCITFLIAEIPKPAIKKVD